MPDLFVPEGLGADIYRERYAFYPEETYADGSRRLGNHVAAAESDFKRWSDSFTEVIGQGDLMPGGRIWYGAGRPVAQLLNCYVIPTEDSREGWAKMVGDNIIIAGMGGGVGENYGNIRPRGSEIVGTGGTSSGAVSIMRIENAALEEIRNGGSRRAARMMSLPLTHPDILEFITAKSERSQLNNANMSVIFDEDPQVFFERVRNHEEIELVFNGKVYSKVPARYLWDKILDNMLAHGEPGLLNGYLANQMNNIAYCRKLVTVNPCGEQWMQPYSTCCLAALVLPRFVKESRSKDISHRIDWERLHHAVTTGIRFLDDVLSVTHYPTKEIKQESLDTRRVGLGVMGVHYMLLELGLKYSSPEGLDACDKVAAFIKHAAYDASISLAIEKGPFPLYSWEGVKESEFIKALKPSVRNKIRTHGLRNCSVNTLAPTGTTGMVQGVSTGLEPIFSPGYKKTRRVGEKLVSTIVVDPLFKKMVLAGQDVSNFEGAPDLTPEQHLDMQVVWQKHIDNAISKTINIPQGKYNKKRVSELAMAYFPKLKGFTIYPEGSREDAPYQRIPLEEAIKAIHDGPVEEEISDDCASGVCER